MREDAPTETPKPEQVIDAMDEISQWGQTSLTAILRVLTRDLCD